MLPPFPRAPWVSTTRCAWTPSVQLAHTTPLLMMMRRPKPGVGPPFGYITAAEGGRSLHAAASAICASCAPELEAFRWMVTVATPAAWCWCPLATALLRRSTILRPICSLSLECAEPQDIEHTIILTSSRHPHCCPLLPVVAPCFLLPFFPTSQPNDMFPVVSHLLVHHCVFCLLSRRSASNIVSCVVTAGSPNKPKRQNMGPTSSDRASKRPETSPNLPTLPDTAPTTAKTPENKTPPKPSQRLGHARNKAP